MGWIIAIIVGGIIGWLASLVMNRDASMGIFWNVVVGIVGSVIGNLIANQFGWAGSIQEFSLTGLIIAFSASPIWFSADASAKPNNTLISRRAGRYQALRPFRVCSTLWFDGDIRQAMHAIGRTLDCPNHDPGISPGLRKSCAK